MNEVDEILGTNNKTNNYSTNKNYTKNQNKYRTNSNRNNYSTNRYKNKSNWQEKKNNWKQQQDQDRQAIYDTMDRMATIVGNDSKKFKQYLDIQSRFSKHSVGNCLVLLEKAPNSTRIKDESSWNEIGIELISNAKSVKILEPNKSNNRIYYNPKEVYDITQTNAPKEEIVKKYDDRKLLEAIISDCEVPRKSVDKLPNGTLGSEYNRDENVLYVCKGMDRELLFQTLFQELGNIEMKDEENSNIKNFRSYCISYMLCEKYGIDVSGFDFSNLPEELTNQKEPKGVRGELNIIRGNFESIDTKIYQHFEINNKEKNKSVPER